MEHIDRSTVRASQQVSSRKSTFDLNSYLSLPSDSRSYHFSPACFSPTASHDVRDLCPNSLFSFSATKVSLELPYRFHFPSSSHTFRFPSFFLLRAERDSLLDHSIFDHWSRVSTFPCDHC